MTFTTTFVFTVLIILTKDLLTYVSVEDIAILKANDCSTGPTLHDVVFWF